MDGLRFSAEVCSVILFLIGLLVGFVFGYAFGLFVDRLDKDIKDDRR